MKQAIRRWLTKDVSTLESHLWFKVGLAVPFALAAAYVAVRHLLH